MGWLRLWVAELSVLLPWLGGCWPHTGSVRLISRVCVLGAVLDRVVGLRRTGRRSEYAELKLVENGSAMPKRANERRGF